MSVTAVVFVQRNRVWNPEPETGEEQETEGPAPELIKPLPPNTLKWLTKENENGTDS